MITIKENCKKNNIFFHSAVVITSFTALVYRESFGEWESHLEKYVKEGEKFHCWSSMGPFFTTQVKSSGLHVKADKVTIYLVPLYF